MKIQLDISILNENKNQQKSKLNQLFIEFQQIHQQFSLISQKNTKTQNSTLFLNQNLIVHKKKTCNLFSKFTIEIIVQFTLYLNVKQIMQLRRVNKLFNLIICKSLPIRIIQYQHILENIQSNLIQIPQIINMIPEQNFLEEDIFIDWDNVWNFKEINKIYGSKELEPEIYQVFKFMYISIYPDFPEVITLEQIKKMLSRPYLRYDVPESNKILTEKQINALQDVMLLDTQKINDQYKFSAYICLLLQKYVQMTKCDAFKNKVQRDQLLKRESLIAERLKILNKLNQKIIK
ncbi:unnamed protein product [Paramecium pentaurelia]|uniref:F-box domain-containing protein n=1 Tax=Paramecium pentaurelia TaxID=43138 RepID=A0A8S1WLU4_9CILI|nr:unnamed protein product [Paramecium pentaurelia]